MNNEQYIYGFVRFMVDEPTAGDKLKCSLMAKARGCIDKQSIEVMTTEEVVEAILEALKELEPDRQNTAIKQVVASVIKCREEAVEDLQEKALALQRSSSELVKNIV